MNLNGLLKRQDLLLSRSAQLRIRLESQAQCLRAPLALADQAQAGLRWLQTHPLWPALALGLYLLKQPRRALVWARRSWWTWRLFSQLKRIGILRLKS